MINNKKLSFNTELSLFLEETTLSKEDKNKITVFTQKHEENAKGLLQSIISVTLTFTCTFLIGLSTLLLIGLQLPIIIALITLCFILGIYLKKENNHLIGNTLICIASILGCFPGFIGIYFFPVWFGMNLIVLAHSNSRFLTVFIAVILNINITLFILTYLSSINILLTSQILATINFMLFAIIHKMKHRLPLLKQHYLASPIALVSLIIFFSLLFMLSF